MPDAWTGNLIGEMHNNGITYEELAAEMGITKSYVSMILNSKRRPKEAQERMANALSAILARKKSEAAQ